MSASRERKKRVGAEQSPAAPKTKKKLSQGWVFTIVVVAVTVLVFGGMFAFRAAERNATVLTVGDYDLSVKNFNYYYYTLVLLRLLIDRDRSGGVLLRDVDQQLRPCCVIDGAVVVHIGKVARVDAEQPQIARALGGDLLASR